MGVTCMVSPEEAEAKAEKRFQRDYRTWAAELFTVATRREGELPQLYSIPLHPPTERQVMADPNAARAWARAWRESALAGDVQWASRNWGSVGRQEVPERLALRGPSDIARGAGISTVWERACSRTLQLAERWTEHWWKVCPSADFDAIATAVRTTIGRCCELDERDWEMLLLALDWLVGNQGATCFARQLPIHGIDTKWIESHRGIVEELHRALTGQYPKFTRRTKQFRVHVLDQRLAPGGLNDLSLSVDQLCKWPCVPDCVLVCENLVNVLALPPLEGTIAVHGGGFAVGELAGVSWFTDVPLFYWGDLDSNGFAILNQLRSHHRHVASLMMDVDTLERHLDLCVEEPTPSKAACPLLTPSEQEALARILAGDTSHGLQTLRLEQERIEWSWSCERIRHALALTTLRGTP